MLFEVTFIRNCAVSVLGRVEDSLVRDLTINEVNQRILDDGKVQEVMLLLKLEKVYAIRWLLSKFSGGRIFLLDLFEQPLELFLPRDECEIRNILLDRFDELPYSCQKEEEW